MDRIAESPKLMLEIIKNLRDVHENKLHEIRRMEAGIEQWVHGGRINAVAFEVGEKIQHEILDTIYEEGNIVKVDILHKSSLNMLRWMPRCGYAGSDSMARRTAASSP